MKKTKLLAVFGVLLALGMTGCGTKTESVPQSGKTQSSQPAAGSSKAGTTSTHTHSFVEDVTQRKEPTCDQPGEKVEKCECGETKKTPIAPLGHQWGTGVDVEKGNGAVAYKKFECEKDNKKDKAVKYEIDFGAYIASLGESAPAKSSAPSGFIKFSSNNSGVELSFDSAVAGQGKLYLRGIMDHWDGENDEKTLFSGKDGGSYVEKDTTNLEIKINDTALVSENKAALNTLLPEIDADHPAAGDSWSAAGDVEFAAMTFNAGVNTISYKRVDSYNMAVSHLVIVFTPTAA